MTLDLNWLVKSLLELNVFVQTISKWSKAPTWPKLNCYQCKVKWPCYNFISRTRWVWTRFWRLEPSCNLSCCWLPTVKEPGLHLPTVWWNSIDRAVRMCARTVLEDRLFQRVKEGRDFLNTSHDIAFFYSLGSMMFCKSITGN